MSLRDTRVIENLNALVQKEAKELRELLADKTLSPIKRAWILERINSMEEKDRDVVKECNKQLMEEKDKDDVKECTKQLSEK